MMDFMPAGKFGEEVRGVRVKRGRDMRRRNQIRHAF